MDKLRLGGSEPSDDHCWSSVARLTRPMTGNRKKVVAHGGLVGSKPAAENYANNCRSKAYYGGGEKAAKSVTTGVLARTVTGERCHSSQSLVCTEESGLISSIDSRTKARVDKGKYRVDAVIDLHGYSEASACEKLIDCVVSSFQSGKRCIRVITGWGSTNLGKGSSIRSNLHRWLQSDTVADMVLYYKQAIPAHGGKGAFYVLLRSNNKA
ncbi:Smr/MutS family protein [Anaplasma capra]|uniref:Smr/MutS family protein n=1 Tax=Anaplasma capra TaxID=1562740 RepID=UPI0021D57A5F|nr:Smr/MutS family protein [Anaplasma capra]MCU7611446.1 Smr/MutS family protein [Anaplasma capra]MCU7612115.1 Smr/MutS family protein [Anaplasma capra]